jgi:predicted nucleic acid-binding Zn ribbon protein
MNFDETGQYQFVIKGQNCTASVRRTRSFRLIQREGEAARTQENPPKPTRIPTGIEASDSPPVKKPKAQGRCANRGPPARLEVRPARKLMRAGESFQFRPKVLDKKGCLLGKQPVWEVGSGSEAVSLSADGTVDVKADAPEAEVHLKASVSGQSVEVVIEVVPQERYEALLAQRGFNAAGESKDAAAASIASGSIGAQSAVSQGGSSSRTTFVAITGALALIVGLVGLVLVQRRRRMAPAPEGPGAVASMAPASLETTTGLSKRCPTCGRQFSGDEQFCTEDATPLLFASSVPPPPAPAAPTSKICPVCGAQYPSIAEFCGNDGSTLVPVN